MVSCIFSATGDLDAEFPAVAARDLGLNRVPLLCAREIDVPGVARARDPRAAPLLRRRGPRRPARVPRRGAQAARGPARPPSNVSSSHGDHLRGKARPHPSLRGGHRQRRRAPRARPRRRRAARLERVALRAGRGGRRGGPRSRRRASTAIRTRARASAARCARRPLRLPVSRIAVGNGSCEILLAAAEALLEPGSEVVYAWPSFSMYPHLAAITGADERARCRSTRRRRHDLEALRLAIDDRTRMVLVCNPNNPTGTHVPSAAVAEFLEKVPARVLVILDEAYVEFQLVEDPDTTLELLERFPNLVLLRTFSKVYGLAGLRVGYALGTEEFRLAVDRVRQPFAVNQLAQVAATEARPPPGRRRPARRAQRRRAAVGRRAARGAGPLPAPRARPTSSGSPSATTTRPRSCGSCTAEAWRCAPASGARRPRATSASATARGAENERFVAALREIVSTAR